MNSRILFRSSPLQQQPQRRVNQQQQQSSGSGEFQPRRSRQPDQDASVTAQTRRIVPVPPQAV